MKVYFLTGNASFVGCEEDTPVLGVFSSRQLAEQAALNTEANNGTYDDDDPAPTRYEELSDNGYLITEFEVDGGTQEHINVIDLVG